MCRSDGPEHTTPLRCATRDCKIPVSEMRPGATHNDLMQEVISRQREAIKKLSDDLELSEHNRTAAFESCAEKVKSISEQLSVSERARISAEDKLGELTSKVNRHTESMAPLLAHAKAIASIPATASPRDAPARLIVIAEGASKPLVHPNSAIAADELETVRTRTAELFLSIGEPIPFWLTDCPAVIDNIVSSQRRSITQLTNEVASLTTKQKAASGLIARMKRESAVQQAVAAIPNQFTFGTGIGQITMPVSYARSIAESVVMRGDEINRALGTGAHRPVDAVRLLIDKIDMLTAVLPTGLVHGHRDPDGSVCVGRVHVCGECQTAKELDECFTDLKKYKAFYDGVSNFCRIAERSEDAGSSGVIVELPPREGMRNCLLLAMRQFADRRGEEMGARVVYQPAATSPKVPVPHTHVYE